MHTLNLSFTSMNYINRLNVICRWCFSLSLFFLILLSVFIIHFKEQFVHFILQWIYFIQILFVHFSFSQAKVLTTIVFISLPLRVVVVARHIEFNDDWCEIFHRQIIKCSSQIIRNITRNQLNKRVKVLLLTLLLPLAIYLFSFLLLDTSVLLVRLVLVFQNTRQQNWRWFIFML